MTRLPTLRTPCRNIQIFRLYHPPLSIFLYRDMCNLSTEIRCRRTRLSGCDVTLSPTAFFSFSSSSSSSPDVINYSQPLPVISALIVGEYAYGDTGLKIARIRGGVEFVRPFVLQEPRIGSRFFHGTTSANAQVPIALARLLLRPCSRGFFPRQAIHVAPLEERFIFFYPSHRDDWEVALGVTIWRRL